ncbi:MAG: hypothetical protein ACPGVJ_01695, partial [Mangrovicoccus sp.]
MHATKKITLSKQLDDEFFRLWQVISKLENAPRGEFSLREFELIRETLDTRGRWIDTFLTHSEALKQRLWTEFSEPSDTPAPQDIIDLSIQTQFAKRHLRLHKWLADVPQALLFGDRQSEVEPFRSGVWQYFIVAGPRNYNTARMVIQAQLRGNK